MFVSTNKVAAIIDYLKGELSSVYDDNEAGTIISMLFEHYLGYSKIDMILNIENSLSESELLLFYKALKRLKNNEPIQHITQKSFFYDLEFKVNEHVLIPRPETEELVDLVIKENPSAECILDLCTGSGCIPISIQNKLSKCQVFGVEKSKAALKIAYKNGLIHKANIKWVEGDVLESDWIEFIEKQLELKQNYDVFDVIVSNPPYIPNSEKTLMSKNVLDFEPDMALFVDNENPLQFYQAIAEHGQNLLKHGGKIYLEINEYYGNEMLSLLQENNYSNCKIIKDLQGKDRVAFGIK